MEESNLYSGYIIQPFDSGCINSAREIRKSGGPSEIYEIFQNLLYNLVCIIKSSDPDKLYFDIKPSNYIQRGKVFVDTQLPWGLPREELDSFFNESEFPYDLVKEMYEKLTTPFGLFKKFAEQSISLRLDLRRDLEELILSFLSLNNMKEISDELRTYFREDK